ncbi:heterokaryon incompatibility protein-domain-containing protein [Xylariaceae sp. FL1272]|nr:heterokaryon incompatibility protein-domain-containing protein [Xylariaceae sp. FL1272]
MTANQSRRRTEATVSEPGDVASHCHPYNPLDIAVHCTRVVEIQAAGNKDYELVCELHQAAFGDRPKYETLSYTWGDTTGDKSITLNGCKFKVGGNLWDALHYLRDTRRQKMHIWIDALCINQSDATSVTSSCASCDTSTREHVPLSSGWGRITIYSKYQDRVLPSQLETFSRSDDVKSDGSSATVDLNENDVEMASELCKDECWTRLWIIQEVTLAAGAHGVRVHVCGHTFKSLLREHIHAKCKEPRDKIYGIVGLAEDARGFTMDYNRSLFDVWKDTMEFLIRRTLLKEDDIVPFGGLVKFLLMGGGECTPLQQSLGSYGSEISSPLVIEDMESPHVFHLDGRILGVVRHVGPSTGEYVADLSKVENWDATIQRLFADRLGAAHQESNTLTEAIHNKSDSEMKRMFSDHVSSVRSNSSISNADSKTVGRMRMEDTSTAPKSGARHALSDTETTTRKGPLLFQMRDENYTGNSQCPWNMGISTSLIQAGDLVCWVQVIRQTIIVRALETLEPGPYNYSCFWKLQIYGSSMVSRDVVGEKFGHQQWNPMQFHKNLPIRIDAATLFVLLP